LRLKKNLKEGAIKPILIKKLVRFLVF
jgi:hypothetical protein